MSFTQEVTAAVSQVHCLVVVSEGDGEKIRSIVSSWILMTFIDGFNTFSLSSDSVIFSVGSEGGGVCERTRKKAEGERERENERERA